MVSKVTSRARKATRVKPVGKIAQDAQEAAPTQHVNGAAPVAPVSVVSVEPVNQAQPDRFAGYQRNEIGLVIVPDDDQKLIDGWYKQANAVCDLGGVMLLFHELNTLYQHSYSSYIHAVVMMSTAMGRLMDMSVQGPADDFQRQMIGFTLLRAWHGIPMDEPIKMFRFMDLMSQSPANVQTFHLFDEYQANWLKRKALDKLVSTPPSKVHPDVRKYWQQLVAGMLPPGFTRSMKSGVSLADHPKE